MNFSEQLRLARLSRGITQRELAEESHVSESLICHFEKGRRIPNREEKMILERVLGTRFYTRRIDMKEIKKLEEIETIEEFIQSAEILSETMALGYSVAQRRVLYLCILLSAGFELYVCRERKQKASWSDVSGDLYLLFENGDGLYQSIERMTKSIEEKNRGEKDTFYYRAGKCGEAAGRDLLSVLSGKEDAFVTEFRVLLSTTSDLV